MLSSYHHGQRRPANGLSALLQSGHHYRSGPMPGRLSTHVGAPAIAGHTGRPGPQPHTAGTATAVCRQNATTRHVLKQVVQKAQDHVRLPTLPFSAYQPGAPGRTPWVRTADDAFGQPWYATKVQEVWVFSHEIDHFGTQEFFVYSPRTKVYAQFTPVGYIAGKAQIQGTASATGEFGRVYGHVLVGTAATFATLGVAAEFEIGTALLASTRGVLIRCGSAVAGQARGLAGKIAEEFTWKNFLAKALVDGSVQFGSGLITKHSAVRSAEDINLVSMLVAGILPGEGWRPALRNSAVNSTFKVVAKDKGNGMRPYLELPELTTMEGAGKYLLNIGFGTLGDMFKGKLNEGVAPLFRLSTRLLSQSEYTALRWFSTQRVVLGTLLGTVGAGSVMDATKDQEKERWEKRLEKVADKKAEAHSAGTTPENSRK